MSPAPSISSTASYDSSESSYHSRPSAASSFTDLSESYVEDATILCPKSNSVQTYPEILSPPALALEDYRNFISSWLSTILVISFDLIYSKLQYGKKGVDFVLPLSPFGDVAVLASRILSEFTPNVKIASIKIDKKFALFKCTTATLVLSVLTQVAANTDYGFGNDGLGRKVIVEYSSPNIAKPFHMGHLRPTILGAFLRNLYARFGWSTIGMNYLGDWGTQFGMIFAGFEKYGSDEELVKEPCKHLFDVYVKINQDAANDDTVKIRAAEFFKRLEDGDKDALALWRRWRNLTVERYGKDYAQLNAHFDVYCAESEVGREWQDQAIQILDRLGHIEDVGTSKWVDLSPWGLEKGVLRKRDGTSIYLSRDIAEAIHRHELYGFDKMIYVVASQQDVHLARLFRILRLMEFDWAERIQHVNHGLVHGPKGDDGRTSKFSTRKGQVIPLDDAINHLTAMVHENMQNSSSRFAEMEDPLKIAEEIAISILKINDFSHQRIKNYSVDPEGAYTAARSGDSGFYLHQTYARLASIRRRNQHLLPLDPRTLDTTLLIGDDVHRLVFLLGKYPDVIRRTMETHQPCKVVTFCFDLCHAVMRLWRTARVYGEKDEGLAKARLFMFDCAMKVLGSAMELLTLRPQDQF